MRRGIKTKNPQLAWNPPPQWSPLHTSLMVHSVRRRASSSAGGKGHRRRPLASAHASVIPLVSGICYWIGAQKKNVILHVFRKSVYLLQCGAQCTKPRKEGTELRCELLPFPRSSPASYVRGETKKKTFHTRTFITFWDYKLLGRGVMLKLLLLLGMLPNKKLEESQSS